MMGVTPGWPLLTKSRRKPPHVQGRAGQAQHPVAIAHLDVYPDLGGLELQVRIDVDVVLGRGLQREVEPAVVGGRPAQGVAGRLRQGLVVVEVIIAGRGAGDEVGPAEQVPAVAVGLAEEQFARGRIALMAQPAARDLAIGEPQGQGQFARHRREDALAVQLREIVGKGPPEVFPDTVQHLPSDQGRRRQGDHARQQQRHQRFSAQTPFRHAKSS